MTRTEYTKVGTIETRLSVAVRLRDAYTRKQLREVPRVYLVDRPEQFTRNRSGYYVLTDLPDDVTSVSIAIDPTNQYLPETHAVDESDLATPPHLLEIDLLPSPAYQFPANTTLLRGTVRETTAGQNADPVPNVDLTIDTEDTDHSFTAMGRSDSAGEYVLFIRGLSSDTVAPTYQDADEDAELTRVVHVDGDLPVVRAVDRATGNETTASVAIEEGTTTSLDIEF